MTRPSGIYLQGLEGYSLDPGFDINTVRDAGNVKGIRDLTGIQYEMQETLTGYGFDLNTTRDAGSIKGIRDLTEI